MHALHRIEDSVQAGGGLYTEGGAIAIYQVPLNAQQIRVKVPRPLLLHPHRPRFSTVFIATPPFFLVSFLLCLTSTVSPFRNFYVTRPF